MIYINREVVHSQTLAQLGIVTYVWKEHVDRSDTFVCTLMESTDGRYRFKHVDASWHLLSTWLEHNHGDSGLMRKGRWPE